jgi:hypothetical protein
MFMTRYKGLSWPLCVSAHGDSVDDDHDRLAKTATAVRPGWRWPARDQRMNTSQRMKGDIESWGHYLRVARHFLCQ